MYHIDLDRFEDALHDEVAKAFSSEDDLANALSEYMPELAIVELAYALIAASSNSTFDKDYFVYSVKSQLIACIRNKKEYELEQDYYKEQESRDDS